MTLGKDAAALVNRS